MSDQNAPADQAQNPNAPVFNMQRVYLKDLSLEMPNAPNIFLEQEGPKVEVTINVGGQALAETVFESTITVTVTGTKTGFTTVSKTSLATAAVASATFATAPNPTISGTATVGQILTAVTTGWDPSSGVTFTYVWKRADTAGGVGPTVGSLDKYTLAPADRGKFITVTVTATKTGYITTSRTSLPTSAVG
jgi:hypothetical protein